MSLSSNKSSQKKNQINVNNLYQPTTASSYYYNKKLGGSASSDNE